MKQIAWRSVLLALIGLLILTFSIIHWYIDYRDLSQLAVGIILALGIFYVSYDQWYKIARDQRDRKVLDKVREHVDENYQGINALNQKILLMEAKKE